MKRVGPGYILWVSVVVVAIIAGSVLDASADDVASSAPATMVPFQPLGTPQTLAARQATREAAEGLDQFLRQGTAANAAAWREFLLWSLLDVPGTGPEPPSTENLTQVATRLLSGEPGLELPPFLRLRRAVLRQIRVTQALSDAQVAERYAQQWEAIQQIVPKAVVEPAAHQAELSGRLEWLEQLDQAPGFVQSVREQFARPNLYLSASAHTLSRGFSEPVSDVTSINEMILKTHVCGTAWTQGAVTAHLVPNPQRAVIELIMQGTSNSQTVGYQRPVIIHSQGVTQILASKRILIDAGAIWDEPACARCTTQSHIQSIQPERSFGARLVERVAWKKAGEQQPLAEQISSRRAEHRISTRFDERVRERLAETNGRMETKVRRPLMQRNVFPRQLRMSTTSDHLYVVARQSSEEQLAAASLPPTIPSHALNLQVHESMLANTAHTAIGGMTITDERAQQLVKDLTGEIPPELELKQDEDPWSITFDLQQPLQVEFKDQHLSIAIRGRKFTRGDQAVTTITQIGAHYKMELAEGRLRLVRQGNVDVSYPGKEGDRLTLAELRNKTFFTGKFEGIFKPVIEGKGWKLGSHWQNLDKLALQFVNTSNGWLSLGWN